MAGVLKLYFRGLENPLFPKERFQDLISTISKYPWLLLSEGKVGQEKQYMGQVPLRFADSRLCREKGYRSARELLAEAVQCTSSAVEVRARSNISLWLFEDQQDRQHHPRAQPWAARAAGPCPWLWVVGGVVSCLDRLGCCPACADLGG